MDTLPDAFLPTPGLHNFSDAPKYDATTLNRLISTLRVMRYCLRELDSPSEVPELHIGLSALNLLQ